MHVYTDRRRERSETLFYRGTAKLRTSSTAAQEIPQASMGNYEFHGDCRVGRYYRQPTTIYRNDDYPPFLCARDPFSAQSSSRALIGALIIQSASYRIRFVHRFVFANINDRSPVTPRFTGDFLASPPTLIVVAACRVGFQPCPGRSL